MKVIVITDTHLGARNNNLAFIEFQMSRWEELFRYAKKKGITTFIHAGDFFENRQTIGVHVLAAAEKFNQMVRDNDIDFHLLVGNHDVAYKNDNRVNSPEYLLDSVNVYWKEPVTMDLGQKIDLIPWINNENLERTLEFIKNSDSKACIGHFEISGAPFHRGGAVCEHGLDASSFSRYDRVLSGHFHTRSKIGKVEYIGAGFEYTWADWNDPRGFVVLDTDTLDVEYINWPQFMFVVGSVDGEGTITFTPDCNHFTGKYVRLVCETESNKKVERAIEGIEKQEPLELQVFYNTVKDVSLTTVDTSDVADEMQVMRMVVEESVPDEKLRQDVNMYLEQLYREANAE